MVDYVRGIIRNSRSAMSSAPNPNVGALASTSLANAASADAPSCPELIARLYEHSLVPVREIARLAGITERNVYATVRRLGCRPRMRTAPGGGRRVALDYEGPEPAALDEAALARALTACSEAAQRQREASAAKVQARRQKALARRRKRASEADARTLSMLAQAMRDLAIVEDAVARQTDVPASRTRELAEQRQALARKLEGWVRGQEEAARSQRPSHVVRKNERSLRNRPASQQPRIRGC